MSRIGAEPYLAALVLRGRRCLVVGAGSVGLEKIEGLLACSAEVRVVAPRCHDEVVALAREGALELLNRPYEPRDLDGCYLAVAATSDEELNRRVFTDCEARRIFCNVVDAPALCSFILPAVLRSGPIAIAVSTSGTSPVLAQRMRDEIGAAIGPEYARLAELLDSLRDWAKEHLPTYDARRDFFASIVNGRPDPIELLRAGRSAELDELIAARRAAALGSGEQPGDAL
jgi:siroheme synthase-like protein